jgi:hypothetical protein
MKRGLYDIEITPNSFQEIAILFHEVRDSHRKHAQSVLEGFGSDLKEPDDAMDRLKELLVPGATEREEDEVERKTEYIRSMQDVDWSEEFDLVEEPDQFRDDPGDPLDRYK